MAAERAGVRHLLFGPFADLQHGMALALARRPARGCLAIALGAIVSWFAYVPVHELLHALGCVATGGRVSELQVDAVYGGALLARVFDFVVVGDGSYAGRLSGFDTGGSDLVYLATDFAPYLLSVFVGVPLLRACARRARAFALGVGAVVGLAPFYNVAGDYYEMGSILVTRVAGTLSAGGLAAWEGLRSDDVFLLMESVSGAAQWAIVAAGLLSGVALAFLSGAAGVAVADLVVGARAATAEDQAPERRSGP